MINEYVKNAIRTHFGMRDLSSHGRVKMRRAVFLFYLLVIITTPVSSFADPISNQSKWEFGLGLGALSLPHYRGSDQRHEYFAPIPYVRYNGDRLKVDREGGRYYFYDSRKIKLDLNATFDFPVDSD